MTTNDVPPRVVEVKEPFDVDVMRANLHATFNGGHQEPATIAAFHHGMDTVCNVLADHIKGGRANGIRPEPADSYSLFDRSLDVLQALRRAVWFFKTAAADASLSDAEVRNIVRFLSAEPLSARDIERTRELAERYGWERARLTPEPPKEDK